MTRDAAAKNLSFILGRQLPPRRRPRPLALRGSGPGRRSPEAAWCRDNFTGKFGPGQTCPGET